MRYLLPAILLLGTQIASAQSILKDKEECHKGIDVGKRLFEWTHTSNPGSLVFIVQQT